MRELLKVLADLAAQEGGLEGTGFDEHDVEELLRRVGCEDPAVTQDDEQGALEPGGKDQLAIETLGHFAAQLEQRMSALLGSNGDPLKALRKFLLFTVKSLAESDFRDQCLECVRLKGLKMPQTVREATDQYLDDQNTLVQWDGGAVR